MHSGKSKGMEKVGKWGKIEQSELGGNNVAQRDRCQGKKDSLESRTGDYVHLLREQKGRALRKTHMVCRF